MRYHDEEDYEDDYDDDYLMNEMDYRAIESQLDFVGYDINQRTMLIAMKFLESSFWWRFLSYETKLERLQKTYKFLTANLYADKE